MFKLFNSASSLLKTTNRINLIYNPSFSVTFKINFNNLKYGSDPSNPQRSQKGLWHLKRHNKTFSNCFSEKKSVKTQHVNVLRNKFYSKVLKRELFIPMTTKARRTIIKYGSLDNYIYKCSSKVIRDSTYARMLKKLITNKNIKNQSQESLDLNMKALKLPYMKKRKMVKTVYSNYHQIPSIYVPPISRRIDISDRYYTPEQLLTRVEKTRIAEINRDLEIITDPDKRAELRSELKQLNREDHNINFTLFKEVEAQRHLEIRNTFMKMKTNFKKRLRYIEDLRISENEVKKATGAYYKHYSEDYPEVQLMLQKTELQRIRSSDRDKIFQKTDRDLGEFDGVDLQHDPFIGKSGVDRYWKDQERNQERPYSPPLSRAQKKKERKRKVTQSFNP